MGTPYTKGKNAETPKGGTGKFTKGTGGHTSRGVHKPAHGATKSGMATSDETTRVGNLGIRARGNSGAFKKDHYAI